MTYPWDPNRCDICRSAGRVGKAVTYDDFYGSLCQEHYEKKVLNATVNPWTGRPLEKTP